MRPTTRKLEELFIELNEYDREDLIKLDAIAPSAIRIIESLLRAKKAGVDPQIFVSIFNDFAALAIAHSNQDTEHEKLTLELLQKGETQQVATLEWEAGFSNTAAGTAAKYAIAAHCDPAGFLGNMCGMATTLLYKMVSEFGAEVIERCAERVRERLDEV